LQRTATRGLNSGAVNLRTVIRWVLVVPSAVVAWYVAVSASALVFAVVVTPCKSSDGPPPDFCEAPWFPLELVERLLFLFGAGLSATLVVTVAAIVAPSQRVGVAWTALAVGAIVAGVMGYDTGAFTEAAVAIAAGALTAVMVSRFVSGSRGARAARADVSPSA
jgi:hypothetical protein